MKLFEDFILVLEDQRQFQEEAGLPINDENVETKLRLTEGYCLKTIEEVVEFRKTFPSYINRVEKNPAALNRERSLEEFADIVLFLMNIMLVWNYTPADLVNTMISVQTKNFAKLQEKKICKLTSSSETILTDSTNEF